MIVKALAAAALTVAPVAVSSDTVTFVNYPGVYLVSCDEGSGTGFRTGHNHFFSVAHVTALHNCRINGVPIKVTEQDSEHDFSQFDADIPGPALRYTCEGFHAGDWVWAIGYAGGRPIQTGLPVYTTYALHRTGFRIFIGEQPYIPGMSGGPVFNARGEVVGTVNAYNAEEGLSFSRDLRDTSVCNDSASARP